jgi:hypothetical protein
MIADRAAEHADGADDRENEDDAAVSHSVSPDLSTERFASELVSVPV